MDAVAEPETEQDRRLPHLPSLDGLRALAVVLTTFHHLEKETFSGGFLGVDIFFVLSGFLITSLLLGTYGRYGRIDLRAFYVRRFRRLVPAVVVLLIVYSVTVLLSSPTHRELMVALVVDGGVLTYTFNWTDAFGHAPPWQLDHLWSLSVEEQFYLLWPIALILLLKVNSRRLIMGVTAFAVLASAIGQAVVFEGTHSVFWGYAASPFHAHGILLGCLLGQLYVWRRTEPALEYLSRSRVLPWAALATLVGLTFVLDLDHEPTYSGGMALGVVAAALLLASLVARDTLGRRTGLLPRLFGSRIMVAIGVRSYSIYLWQNFMAWALTPALRGTVWWIPGNILATLVCAEISYRFVERRFLTPSTRADRYAPADAAPVSAGQRPLPADVPPSVVAGAVASAAADAADAVASAARELASGPTDGEGTGQMGQA